MDGEEVVVAISGSRKFPNHGFIRLLVKMLKETGVKRMLVGYNTVARTPGGVDRWAYEAAVEFGLDHQTYPAVWMVNGKKNMNGGLIRNIEMLADANRVIACWDGTSRGTAHMIVAAHKHGKLFRIYAPAGVPQEPKELLKMAYAVRNEPFIEPVAENSNAE